MKTTYYRRNSQYTCTFIIIYYGQAADVRIQSCKHLLILQGNNNSNHNEKLVFPYSAQIRTKREKRKKNVYGKT